MTVAIPDDGEPLQLGSPEHLHLAWRILAGGAPQAAAALVDVACNGIGAPRVAAAKTILEMTGFKTPDVVPVLPPEHDLATSSAMTGDSPAARIRSRLAALVVDNTPAAAPDLDDLVVSDPEVVDGTVADQG